MDVYFSIAKGNFRQNSRFGGCGNWVSGIPCGLKSCCKFEASNLNEGNMGVWRQLAEYFYIKKRDPKAPHSKWMGYMHGINRISLFMFLVALIIIFVKMIFFRK
jgi:hypothetical protein